MNDPRIVRSVDADGSPIVYVEMSNRIGVFATLDADDFDALMAAGVSSRWLLNSTGVGLREYVRVTLNTVKGSVGTIARMITNAGGGEVVTYRNGQTTDLRRANLNLEHGRGAKGRTPLPAELADEFAPVPPPLPPVLQPLPRTGAIADGDYFYRPQ